ncbi:conserved hypothetical protein [Magnetospirillum sp. LM-5]|uniref:KilA-N domain-containing protein n=1 Tax=Magnetospirillum sp. LM-5 TaxID=2681466 RepID=UPI00137F05EA|nr:KilA-N domain-containing protein [Magnetospirillum sp. LM-5]CAA7619930.1 conserved hypothetical protein [Magnetospirillum sp. LM-5]
MTVSKHASQYELALIPHKYQGELIAQRPTDGYINATAMCKAGGKLLGHYLENGSTQKFLGVLTADIGIPISDLIQKAKGGDPGKQGTWVHPQVAIDLAQWISPEFRVQVSKWIFEWMSGATSTRVTHDYVQRYSMNAARVPQGHFSIISVVYQDLYGPLEHAGKIIADKAANGTAICPDISVGRVFAEWLRDNHPNRADDYTTYSHVYLDGRVIPDARAYPWDMYPLYRQFWETVWLPQRSSGYLKPRDPAAAALLPTILPAPAPKKKVGKK